MSFFAMGWQGVVFIQMQKSRGVLLVSVLDLAKKVNKHVPLFCTPVRDLFLFGCVNKMKSG